MTQRNSSPGCRRKGIKIKAPVPNPVRRACKLLNGTVRHLAHERGAYFPAPTIDQVRRLERRYNRKLVVFGGIIYDREEKGQPFDRAAAEKQLNAA